MSDEIDTMSGEPLAAAFYTEVLGEAKPPRESVMTIGERRGLWVFTISGVNQNLEPTYDWQPVPLDGNAMMRGIRAMAEWGYQWEVVGGVSWLDYATQARFTRADGDFWKGMIHNGDIIDATARSALKAIRGEANQ